MPQNLTVPFKHLATCDMAMHLCRRIKEKRARLQGVHMAPDYVPLGGITAPLTTDAALRPASGAATAPAASGSDSEPEQEETLHMTFLGDAHKRGKARPGVFSSLADEDQVHSMHMPVPHSLQACCSSALHSCFALQC